MKNLTPERLRALAEELKIRLPVDDAALDRALRHFELLYSWNRRFNLTAIRDPADGVRLHLLESLAGLVALPAPDTSSRPRTLVDLGSGNGYPAIPLIAARPDLHGLLIEATARKADFLRAAARSAGIHDRTRIVQTRVTGPEDVPDEAAIVTLRAFPRPVEWIEGLVFGEPRRSVLAWLGRRDADVLLEALIEQGIRAAAHDLQTRTDAVLLIITC